MTSLDPSAYASDSFPRSHAQKSLESRLANDESPIVTARVQIGSAFFLLFCFVWFLLVCFVFVIVVVFHIQDPWNVYVQIFAPCKD